MKLLDYIRQPVCGNTGKCTNSNQTRLQTVELIHLHLQLVIFGADILCVRKKSQSIRSQTDTAPATFQKNNIPFLFQISDHPADPGLGVGECFGSFCETAIFNSLKKGLVFLYVDVHMGSFQFEKVRTVSLS